MSSGLAPDGQPVQIESALRWAILWLTERGCEEARLDAELLLAHRLGCSRGQLLGRAKQTLDAQVAADFALLAQRRAEREPLAYITGHREFYGLDLLVDRRVLIPRPETELLVELALAHVRKAPERASRWRIADVGTGSGAVAIALARQLPDATLYGLDISAEALAVAAANCARHGVSERVIPRRGDLLSPLDERVDVIVANLPYIRDDEWDSLAPEIRIYEPSGALRGGADGLDLIRRLLSQAQERISPGGAIFLEIGASQGEGACAAAREAFPHGAIRLHQDYGGHDRVAAIEGI